jgi:hypothetical protein
MSEKESLQLERIAGRHKLTAAGVIRLLLAREDQSLGRRESPDETSFFSEAERLYQKDHGKPSGAEGALSGFGIEHGKRYYYLRSRNLLFERFTVLKNGKLRVA